MASRPFNIGIIGYGMSAKVFHIPLISVVSYFKLYAIVQRHPKPDDDAEQDHPGIKSYRSTEEMVKDGEVDVVVVTTIPDTHFELTKLALENGKHVIIEKPFTPTSSKADSLIALAKSRNLLLTVYQNRRYDTDFLTFLSLLKSQRLGRIATFETHFDRHRPAAPSNSWKTAVRPGGGAIYDLGTHLIDQVVVAFGMPKRVTGFVYSQREGGGEGKEGREEQKIAEGGNEDSCTVLLHYDTLLATVKCEVISAVEEQLRFLVKGVEGTWRKNNLDPQEQHLKTGMKPEDPGFGLESQDSAGILTTLQSDGTPTSEPYPNITPATYVAFYSQFAKALRGRGDVPVRAEEARGVIKIIELARESSRVGRTMDLQR